MPAEAIVAFTFSIIGFYNTLRIGIEKLYEDKETIANFTDQVADLEAELAVHKGSIDGFQRRWMIWHEKTPDSLFEEFWGTRVNAIETRLDNINRKCITVDRKLKGLIPVAGQKLLPRICHQWKGRVTFVFGLKPRTKNLLTEITTQIKHLEVVANLAWRTKRGAGDNPSDEQIHRVGNKKLLTDLAIGSEIASNLMHEAYRFTRNEVDLELEMNLFISEPQEAVRQDQMINGKDKRNSQIVQSAARASLNFSFLAREINHTGDPKTRVRVQLATGTPDQHEQSFREACKQAIRREKEPYYFRAANDVSFEVQRSQWFCEEGMLNPRSYREILSESPGPEFANPRYLRLASKSKVAFELVEYGMLLLNTPWFAGLCSCGVLCRMKSNGETLCSLTPSDVTHEHPRWGTIVAPNCWCSAQVTDGVLSGRVQRLGILLVELALGRLAREIYRDAAGGITHVAFMRDDPPVYDRLSIAEICQAVDTEMESTHYTSVVGTCLKYQPDARRSPRQLLEDYYNEILIP